MEVGSKAEMVLLTSLVAAYLALYPVSGVGFRGGLQHLLSNFEMAKDTFIEQAGTKWFTPELEAIDNLTLEHITCQCPVLGAWQSELIVLHEGEPRAVGHSQVHHNLYPTSAKLIEGEPLRVVSHRGDMRGRSLAERQQVLASIAEKFSLSGEEAAELVALSKEEAREATDFFSSPPR
jgi:inner membrane protein